MIYCLKSPLYRLESFHFFCLEIRLPLPIPQYGGKLIFELKNTRRKNEELSAFLKWKMSIIRLSYAYGAVCSVSYRESEHP